MNLNVSEAQSCSNVAKHYVSTLWDDEKFKSFYSSAVSDSKDVTSEPCHPRNKRFPRGIDDGSESHVFTDVESYYRKQYFEALDKISEELRTRFSSDILQIPLNLKKLVIDSANGDTWAIPASLKDIYKDVIDFNLLSK